MQTMLAGMEGRLSTATSELRTTVTVRIDGAMNAIGDLSERVRKSENKINNVARDLTKIDAVVQDIGTMVDEKIEEGLRRHRETPLSDDNPATCPRSSDLSVTYASAVSSFRKATPTSLNVPIITQSPVDKKTNDYWRARQVLRLRPIKEGDEHEEVTKFMKDYLKIDSQLIARLGDFVVERVPFGPKSKQQHEAIVRFATVEARDIVRGSASNLAGHGTDVGVRLEVPNHLKSHMAALQKISYEIKTKNPGSKRNVLYDDNALDLVLDFSQGEGQTWRRITARQAKIKSKGVASVGGRSDVRDEELDKILGRERATGEESDSDQYAGPSGFGGDRGGICG